MKKTIIALLVLPSVAGAAMTDGLVAWWTFDNGSTDYTTYTGLTSGVSTGLRTENMHQTGGVDNKGYISSHCSYINDAGTAVSSNMDFYNDMSGMDISASSFTLSFKVRGATADYRSLFSMTIGNYGQVNMQTENTANGDDTCLYAPAGTNGIEITENAVKTAIKAQEGWANVILTGNGTTLALTVNGYSASVAYSPGEGIKLSDFQLGSMWGDGGRRVVADFDDLAIWNRTLSTEEVALLSKGAVADGTLAAPEPTTATLSMLALAGLAVRRRRKQ